MPDEPCLISARIGIDMDRVSFYMTDVADVCTVAIY